MSEAEKAGGFERQQNLFLQQFRVLSLGNQSCLGSQSEERAKCDSQTAGAEAGNRTS